MDYRFLVQKNLKEWEEALETGIVGTCYFCLATELSADTSCGECPMFVSEGKSCCTMVLNGRVLSNVVNPDYIRGCISFYTEWLRTGIMPTVEYR